MLQKIRDNSSGLVAKLFIGFVILVFALFGVETLVGTLLNSNPELKVNDSEISALQIDELTRQKTQQFYNELGPDADLSGIDETMFRESAIDELIQRELLTQSASRTGMTVSSASIDNQILQTSEFQVDGVFNEERANILLQSMGYTGSSYRTALAEESLLNQLLTSYSVSGFATERELETMARLVHQKRSFRYVTVGLDSSSADIAISDEAVQTFYDENQDAFQREEQVQISYLVLDREAMLEDIEISEDEVRALYDEEVAAYQAETERRAAHILFEASDDAGFSDAEQRAEEVRAMLDDGQDFADLAEEYSDDIGSAGDGGDIGYTTGDSFTPQFENALQALAVGEVSQPVRTEFGVHLIKLLELNETEIEPFEARRDELTDDLRRREVDSLFIARSEELGNLAFESIDLQEPADIMEMELQESDWFGRSGGTGITAASGVINAAFSAEVLQDRLNSELIQIDQDRSVVIHVTDHRLPETRPLEEVRGEIMVSLRLEQMREQASMIGETILEAVRSGVDVQSLLEAQDLSWTMVNDAERDNPEVNPEIMEEVFALGIPEGENSAAAGFQLSNGGYAVIQLQEITDGSMDDLEEGEAGNMRNFISQQGAALDFAGFLTSLQEEAEISGRQEVTEF